MLSLALVGAGWRVTDLPSGWRLKDPSSPLLASRLLQDACSSVAGIVDVPPDDWPARAMARAMKCRQLAGSTGSEVGVTASGVVCWGLKLLT